MQATQVVSPAPSRLPGLRTLHSPRFRLLLALMLTGFAIGLVAIYVSQLVAPETWLLVDFEPYFRASERMLAGGSLYTSAQLDSPIDAVCAGCYLYPPLLAQAFAPLTLLPIEAARVVWMVALTILMVATVWLATGVGGARATLERFLWSVVAVAFYVPVIQSVGHGNVSTLVALSVTLVAMGGSVAGLGAAAASFMKVAPATLIPAAFVADSRSRRALILSLTALFAASFLLAPQAWIDYPSVLRNMLAGSGDTYFNLAPAVMASRADLPEAIVSLVRAGTIIVAVVAVVASVWLARRGGGMPAAALLASLAMLVAPGTIWYHYMVVLLPIAAMAWPRASNRSRVVMLGSAGIITIGGVTVLPLAAIGAAVLLLVAGWVLWPRCTSPAARVAASSAAATRSVATPSSLQA